MWNARNSFRLKFGETSHSTIPTLLFTDLPESPTPAIHPTLIGSASASRQVSIAYSTTRAPPAYGACYGYGTVGTVAVCAPVACLCDTDFCYGAAAHAFLPGRNALPWMSYQGYPPPGWVSRCSFGSAASDLHATYGPLLLSFVCAASELCSNCSPSNGFSFKISHLSTKTDVCSMPSIVLHYCRVL